MAVKSTLSDACNVEYRDLQVGDIFKDDEGDILMRTDDNIKSVLLHFDDTGRRQRVKTGEYFEYGNDDRVELMPKGFTVTLQVQ